MLEERISRLIQEVERVRAENDRILKEGNSRVAELQSELHSLREENQTLNVLLTEETQVKNNILQRVDGLLDRLKNLD